MECSKQNMSFNLFRPGHKRTFGLSIAALGVVYGDIGTSPLYALRESLDDLPINDANVFGILSLIFWSLLLIVSVKYLCYIIKADNDGEGGVLALLALLKRKDPEFLKTLTLVGIFGAGLLLGDAMLTPAISVMSAMEGLQLLSPALDDYIVPGTVVLLMALFFFQKHGTGKIGIIFGPILIVWFLSIGILGAIHIMDNLAILKAMNPSYAVDFFVNNGWKGYMLLGGVFLVLTGGEALYADLGHFGKAPIRVSWFSIVLPGLVLNYFGQGAHLLKNPSAIQNPFYALAPEWFAYPLLILATLATIIASQAVISAAFSLTSQAILLDFCPRLRIIQTSARERGQVYIPQINLLLAIGTLFLVLNFRSSSALTHAYGIAVNLVMFTVTLMLMRVAQHYWKWSWVKMLLFFGIFIPIDLAFLWANMHKLESGGWIPMLFGALAATVMLTWEKGISFLRTTYYNEKIDLKTLVEHLTLPDLNYLPNATAVFITDPYDQSGGGLLHYLKLNRIIPECVLIVGMKIEHRPYVMHANRYQVGAIAQGIYRLTLHYGFMEHIDIPSTLKRIAPELPFPLDVDRVCYLVEITHVSVTLRKKTLFFQWQEQLFAFLMRNATLDIEFLKLPYNRTVAIGNYCEI
jgi:KUP system potassium uptake protein